MARSKLTARPPKADAPRTPPAKSAAPRGAAAAKPPAKKKRLTPAAQEKTKVRTHEPEEPTIPTAQLKRMTMCAGCERTGGDVPAAVLRDARSLVAELVGHALHHMTAAKRKTIAYEAVMHAARARGIDMVVTRPMRPNKSAAKNAVADAAAPTQNED